METQTIILAFLLPLMALLFFCLGKYVERAQWNKLIERGILPKPFKKK